MNEPIHEETYRDLIIKIYQDDNAESPREWDNIGKMVCFHRHYVLGDKHTLTVEDTKELMTDKTVVALPLYLYDHSGITMSVNPFSCQWDSGQVGIIYVELDKMKKEFPSIKLRKKLIEQAKKSLIQEVKTYDDYITGNVYGYVIEDKNGNNIESCWGFLGYYDGEYGALSEAKSVVDSMTEKGKREPNRQYLLPLAV